MICRQNTIALVDTCRDEIARPLVSLIEEVRSCSSGQTERNITFVFCITRSSLFPSYACCVRLLRRRLFPEEVCVMLCRCMVTPSTLPVLEVVSPVASLRSKLGLHMLPMIPARAFSGRNVSTQSTCPDLSAGALQCYVQ